MGWRIIELNENTYCHLYLNNLVLSGNNKRFIPIDDIDILLINNYSSSISVGLLNSLSAKNAVVIFCDKNHLPQSINLPFIGNCYTNKKFLEQISWDVKIKSKWWKWIIQTKIRNQIDLLLFHSKINIEEFNNMSNYIEHVDFDDKTNREGHIAKLYWHRFMNDVKFTRDNKINQVNGALNYGYTILNAMIARSIVKKGIDFRIGIHHKNVYNPFPLASDIIEIFRCVIDSFVIDLIKENYLKNINDNIDSTIRSSILEYIANYQIVINGKIHYLNNAIDMFIDFLIADNLDNFSIIYDLKNRIICDE